MRCSKCDREGAKYPKGWVTVAFCDACLDAYRKKLQKSTTTMQSSSKQAGQSPFCCQTCLGSGTQPDWKNKTAIPCPDCAKGSAVRQRQTGNTPVWTEEERAVYRSSLKNFKCQHRWERRELFSSSYTVCAKCGEEGV